MNVLALVVCQRRRQQPAIPVEVLLTRSDFAILISHRPEMLAGMDASLADFQALVSDRMALLQVLDFYGCLEPSMPAQEGTTLVT